mmetsp:Transcript_6427/g.16341  ORF Transcript_6427/g.16341 Transcript_6427/m.16341 type:complete len:210 (+) Transcript_6427:1-630(+)
MAAPSPPDKKIWKMFWDLQCPYSKKNWAAFNSSIKDKFRDDFDFKIYLTSLAFHPQAFLAQCGASLVETYKGRSSLLKYVDTCFNNQDSYMNSAVGDARKSEIVQIFADIAEKAGVLDENDDEEGEEGDDTSKMLLTKSKFIQEINDWEKAIKPAYTEHKIALGFAVYGTPKHVIDEKLINDTESDWTADDWMEKLHNEGLLSNKKLKV